MKPSRTEGNTRLYTDDDLQRLEIILSLARDLGVNISGIAIILDMRERMEEMQRQMHEFLTHFQQEMLARMSQADASKGALIPVRRPATPVPSTNLTRRGNRSGFPPARTNVPRGTFVQTVENVEIYCAAAVARCGMRPALASSPSIQR